jgi:biotin operon repressor
MTDPDARIVLEWLSTAHDQRVTYSREQLVSRTGLPDRTIRAAIQTLRGSGYPVWSDPGHAGYRLARDESEVEELAARFERTGKQHLVTASRLRNRYERTMPIDQPDQPSLL